MDSQPSFEQLIKEDRATRDAKRWRGTLLEYLELVRKDATITKLAHARVYEMMMRAGARDILETDEPTRVLGELTTAAMAEGRELEQLEVRRPTLEDVYLELIEENEE